MKMKHIKTPQELNEASENLNISDVMNSILNDLQKLKDDSDKEISLMKHYTLPTDKYYIKEQIKSESFAEAIKIVKKYYS